MLHDHLRQLGFNDKEREVYLAILRSGKASPADIAKETRINRTTVYAVSKVLREKGVITEDLGGKASYLTALPPERLLDQIVKQQQALETQRQIARTTIAELSQLRSDTRYSIPKIRFVEEPDVEKHLYRQFPLWIESSRKLDTTCWGLQDHTFVECFPEWLAWSWEEYPESFVRLLSNRSDSEARLKGKLSPHRQVAFWERADDFTATTWIVGDFLIMIMTRQHPFYLMEIHDPVLAHNQREIFRNIWEKDIAQKI